MRKKIMLAIMILGTFLFSVNVSALIGEVPKSLMTVSPPIEKIVLLPGETYEGSVNVTNSSTATKDLKYSVYIGSFNLGKDENGETDYNYTDVETVTGYNQIMEWISLGKNNGVVVPGSTDVIPYKINVPTDAPAGGQYASIIIRNDTEKDQQSASNSVSIENVVEFAVSVIAEVAGETREGGQVIENSIPTFLFDNKLTAVSRVKNTGNVHANAKYVLQVWPLFSDEEICTNEEKPSESLIMPDTERMHAEECSNLPTIGLFKVKQTVEIFGEKSEAEKMVFVCPLWLLFVIIAGLILLVMWYVAKARTKNK